MRFTKYYLNGHSAEVEIQLIEDHGRYGLYQVYKVDGEKLIPMYKECFSPFDIKRIGKRGMYMERFGVGIGEIILTSKEGDKQNERTV